MKFAILHHDACRADAFHYRIDPSGERISELAEAERGIHAKSIGVVLEGDFDSQPPTQAQLHSLHTLLLELKKRYPDLQVGGHRQVRGDETSCPGDQFPLTELRQWSQTELIEKRDAAMQEDIDRQYYRP